MTGNMVGEITLTCLFDIPQNYILKKWLKTKVKERSAAAFANGFELTNITNSFLNKFSSIDMF